MLLLFLWIFVGWSGALTVDRELRDRYHTPTEIWLMQLKPGTDPRTVARRMHLEYLHAMPSPPETPLYAFKQKKHGVDFEEQLVEQIRKDENVEWHERQFSRQQIKKSVSVDRYDTKILDPLFPNQWHLQDSSPVHLDVVSVWNKGKDYRGQGALVAVVDDGLQRSHPDFRENYDAENSHDYNGSDEDPTPSRGDGHGTSAAGVACAGRNSACGVGVCPECKIAGIRLIGGPSTDYSESMGLSHKSNEVAVYSCSWGPPDDARTMEMPGYATRMAMHRNAEQGRHGKGSIYMWAGGNGRGNSDDGNYDGYANSRVTIAVGAVSHDGKQAYYSESCACLMVVAPSNGMPGYGIVTTDLMGGDGYDSGDCTRDFGGTSSAAPAAAGVVGLLLGKYPGLTRREVLRLLAETSTRVDEHDSDWTPQNSRGIRHSHKYGWGLINPPALMEKAAHSQPLPKEQRCTTGRIDVSHAIPDGYSYGMLTYPMDLPSLKCINDGAPSKITHVEYVEVWVNLRHRRRGDLSIRLSDPHGVVSRLATAHTDYTANYPSGGWTFGSARHWGQTMKGVWTLTVEDEVHNGYVGELLSYEIVVYGH